MAEVSIEQAECLGDEIYASMYPGIFKMGEENKAYVKDEKGELENSELENEMIQWTPVPQSAYT